MSNEAQNLAEVKEKIKTLNSELSGLLSEQKRLEQVITETERKTNGTVREKMIDEWIEQQSPNFDITFNLNSAFSKEDYDIYVRRNDNSYKFSELFFVRDTMSDSDAKDYLNRITDSLNLIDELIAQNVYNETVFSKAYINKLGIREDYVTGKLYVYIFIYTDELSSDLDLTVRLNKADDNSVQAQVSYDEYGISKYAIRVNNTTDFIIEEHPVKLTSKQIVPFNDMVPEIKKLFKDIENVKGQYIKPVN